MDIKKVMDNALYIFDRFSTILKEGKREGSLSDESIDAKCEEYKTAFLLWDGAFSFARKVNPTANDRHMYRRFVNAAVVTHDKLGCSITHKVHLMWKHVEWQMEVIPGGLGDKMEDWVELAHQIGARLRRRFRTVKDPIIRAVAKARALFRDSDPEVVAYSDALAERSKRNFSKERVLKVKVKKEVREAKRLAALFAYELGVGCGINGGSSSESTAVEALLSIGNTQ
mmetsp:Transcript_15746/g.34083  ORF Transcript_15746/g.34083 Transcript_15746/m.34083 type:complete len:227 (+) Transcript_15746:498-1178(+)